MTLRTFIAATGLAFALSTPAAAQSAGAFGPDDAFHTDAVEARLSFRVPIGPASPAAERAPQLDLGVRRGIAPRPALDAWRLGPPAVRETRLGFTLSESPTLLLDGRALQPVTAEDAELLGLPRPVVGALAVVGTATLAVATAYVCCADFSEE